MEAAQTQAEPPELSEQGAGGNSLRPRGTSFNPCHQPEAEGLGGYGGRWEQTQAGVRPDRSLS